MRPGSFRLLCAAWLALLAAACTTAQVHEVRSEYSRMRIVERGDERSLVFVGEAKSDVVQTLMDMRAPHRLQHPYARTMMAGFLYRPDASSGLLIGLGGGALVRFLQHHFPALRLDVVEIDPVMLEVARAHFGTVPGPRTRFIIEDAHRFVGTSTERYDVLLVDAHLHPGEGTDSTGHPSRLKSEAFMRNVQARLAPGGVALFNMIEGKDSAAYVASVQAAFPATRVFRPSASGNLIVAASATPVPEETLRRSAQALDARGEYGFSFESLLREIVRGPPATTSSLLRRLGE